MKKYITILILLLSTVSFGFDNFQKGSKNPNTKDMTDSEFIAFTLNTRKASEFGVKGSHVLNFLETDDVFFALLKDMNLIGMNNQPKEFLGNWPLTRWEYELFTPGFLEQQYNTADEDVIAGLPTETDLEYQLSLESGVNHLGCLASTPLRYGDIENDGTSELVLTLAHYGYKADVIVFSPQYQRIVFSNRYALQDADLEAKSDQTYQYRRDTSGLSHQQGYKVFSKIFTGDFDENGHPDILVWRKKFRSNLQTDTTLGFKLSSQIWQHFERDLDAQADSEAGITGEYLPQETSEDDIKSWLSDNNLTWRKGYPSVSECEGEKGELILEMHDPLLNDPDVLQ
jgi:hypothetical protein